MSETSNQMKLINSEFKSASAETDQYGNQLDKTGAKKKQLNGVIQQYTQRVKAIKEEQKHWTSELKKGNITETEHAQKQQELARRLNNTEAEMKKYEGQLKKINAEGKATRKTYAEFDKQFRDVGATMRDVGMQVGISAGVGFMAMKRVLQDIAKEAITFEAGMSKVKAISGATGEEMAAMKAQALELNKTTVFTAEQAAAGMEKLALAGWKSADIMSAMPGMLDLAAAGALELSTAADITSDTMQSFGLSAEKAGHAADVFAYAQANANTNVEQMGEAMNYLAPTANSFGWSLEEASAIIMTLADNGLKGSMATQSLGSSIVKLAAPTPKATKLIKKLGMEFFDATGKMKSMPEVVAEMEKGLEGMSEKQKAATMDVLVGKNAFKQWQIILKEGSGALADTTRELENADGAAKDMAETMLDNAHGAIILMQSAISALKIELGEKLLPIITKAAEYIGDLATKYSEMDEETITTIAHTALLVTAVLGVTTAVAGVVAGIGAFMMVAGPVGLAIAAGTLLLGGLAAAAYKSSLETKNLAEKQEEAAVDAVRYGEGLSEGTKKGVKGYVDLYEGAKVKMLELKNMSGEEAEKTVKEIQNAFSEMSSTVIAELEVQRDELSRVINEIYGVMGETGEKAAEKINKEIRKRYDKDIAEHIRAMDTISEAYQVFGGDLDKMPKDFQKSFQEALKIAGDGTQVFAETQNEMLVIQQGIAERQGGILFEEMSGYTKKINEQYSKSIDAALDYDAENKRVLDKSVAQGKTSVEEYGKHLKVAEVATTKMIVEAAREQERSIITLGENLDERGKLIDMSTGEEFERRTWLHENSVGVQTQMEESEYQYYERWKEHKEQVLLDTIDFSEKALEDQKNKHIAALEGIGHTREEAVKEVEEHMAAVLDELDKGEPEAKESGKKLGEAHIDGVESTEEDSKKAGDNISKVTTDHLDLGKWRDKSKDSGKKIGDGFEDGVDSKKNDIKKSAEDISDSTNKGLDKNKSEAENAGKDKGIVFKTGLDGTKTATFSAASFLSSGLTNILSKTTDGGGGKSAGSLFSAGIRGQSGSASTAGKGVANSGKSGLASVKTSSTGSDFVRGFSGSITSGKGTVWTTAWNLGKSALSALKKSIDSRSPSKETGELGDNFGAGFNNAIVDSIKDGKRNATMFGKATTQALSDEIDRYKNNFAAISVSLKKNEQVFRVEHVIDTSKVESQLNILNNNNDNNKRMDRMMDVLERMLYMQTQQVALAQKGISVQVSGREIAKVVNERNALDSMTHNIFNGRR